MSEVPHAVKCNRFLEQVREALGQAGWKDFGLRLILHKPPSPPDNNFADVAAVKVWIEGDYAVILTLGNVGDKVRVEVLHGRMVIGVPDPIHQLVWFRSEDIHKNLADALAWARRTIELNLRSHTTRILDLVGSNLDNMTK